MNCCHGTFLPLLLFGCPLFARFLFTSQAKPVAMKQHRKRGRLKTDTVANDSIGASFQEALATDATLDAFAFNTELISDGSWRYFMNGQSFNKTHSAGRHEVLIQTVTRCF
jgi:hypothetical protein